MGQTTVAEELTKRGAPTSDSTVSRWKDKELPSVVAILSKLGLKVVPTEARCFDPQQIAAIFTLAKERMSQIEGIDQLTWND